MVSLRHRRDGGLDVGRARARISAYVYGNITVLAAVVAATPHTLERWDGVVAVLATAVATLLAHVIAESVAHQVGPRARHELRDATPIATSGGLPAAVLALGTLGVLAPATAQLLAALVAVLRLAGVGVVVERLSGRPPSVAALWGGIGLAVVGAVVAVLKTVLTH
ncbi:hypothetical protein ACFFKU_12685 [Kineococcus gynurae]|uniref:Integral membrane protein n=1 Tax=Kineococcus gynurae TaxID=452979 RepID=A0ABV5LQM3_9ACTN